MSQDVFTAEPHQLVGLESCAVHGPSSSPFDEALVDLARLNALSFGSVPTYAVSGGQPVYSDFGPIQDLTKSSEGCGAVAAFVIGRGSVRVRCEWTSEDCRPHRIFVRAGVDGTPRIREQLVQFDNGRAVLDLPVLGLPTHRVGIVDEHWLWEYRSERGPFVKAKIAGGTAGLGMSFVRIYFTAARPMSAISA